MASCSSSDMYTVPAIQRPSIEQLRSVAEALHLHIPADELEEYKCIYTQMQLITGQYDSRRHSNQNLRVQLITAIPSVQL